MGLITKPANLLVKLTVPKKWRSIMPMNTKKFMIKLTVPNKWKTKPPLLTATLPSRTETPKYLLAIPLDPNISSNGSYNVTMAFSNVPSKIPLPLQIRLTKGPNKEIQTTISTSLSEASFTEVYVDTGLGLNKGVQPTTSKKEYNVVTSEMIKEFTEGNSYLTSIETTPGTKTITKAQTKPGSEIEAVNNAINEFDSIVTNIIGDVRGENITSEKEETRITKKPTVFHTTSTLAISSEKYKTFIKPLSTKKHKTKKTKHTTHKTSPTSTIGEDDTSPMLWTFGNAATGTADLEEELEELDENNTETKSTEFLKPFLKYSDLLLLLTKYIIPTTKVAKHTTEPEFQGGIAKNRFYTLHTTTHKASVPQTVTEIEHNVEDSISTAPIKKQNSTESENERQTPVTEDDFISTEPQQHTKKQEQPLSEAEPILMRNNEDLIDVKMKPVIVPETSPVVTISSYIKPSGSPDISTEATMTTAHHKKLFQYIPFMKSEQATQALTTTPRTIINEDEDGGGIENTLTNSSISSTEFGFTTATITTSKAKTTTHHENLIQYTPLMVSTSKKTTLGSSTTTPSTTTDEDQDEEEISLSSTDVGFIKIMEVAESLIPFQITSVEPPTLTATLTVPMVTIPSYVKSFDSHEMSTEATITTSKAKTTTHHEKPIQYTPLMVSKSKKTTLGSSTTTPSTTTDEDEDEEEISLSSTEFGFIKIMEVAESIPFQVTSVEPPTLTVYESTALTSQGIPEIETVSEKTASEAPHSLTVDTTFIYSTEETVAVPLNEAKITSEESTTALEPTTMSYEEKQKQKDEEEKKKEEERRKEEEKGDDAEHLPIGIILDDSRPEATDNPDSNVVFDLVETFATYSPITEPETAAISVSAYESSPTHLLEPERNKVEETGHFPHSKDKNGEETGTTTSFVKAFSATKHPKHSKHSTHSTSYTTGGNLYSLQMLSESSIAVEDGEDTERLILTPAGNLTSNTETNLTTKSSEDVLADVVTDKTPPSHTASSSFDHSPNEHTSSNNEVYRTKETSTTYTTKFTDALEDYKEDEDMISKVTHRHRTLHFAQNSKTTGRKSSVHYIEDEDLTIDVTRFASSKSTTEITKHQEVDNDVATFNPKEKPFDEDLSHFTKINHLSLPSDEDLGAQLPTEELIETEIPITTKTLTKVPDSSIQTAEPVSTTQRSTKGAETVDVSGFPHDVTETSKETAQIVTLGHTKVTETQSEHFENPSVSVLEETSSVTAAEKASSVTERSEPLRTHSALEEATSNTVTEEISLHTQTLSASVLFSSVSTGNSLQQHLNEEMMDEKSVTVEHPLQLSAIPSADMTDDYVLELAFHNLPTDLEFEDVVEAQEAQNFTMSAIAITTAKYGGSSENKPDLTAKMETNELTSSSISETSSITMTEVVPITSTESKVELLEASGTEEGTSSNSVIMQSSAPEEEPTTNREHVSELSEATNKFTEGGELESSSNTYISKTSDNDASQKFTEKDEEIETESSEHVPETTPKFMKEKGESETKDSEYIPETDKTTQEFTKENEENERTSSSENTPNVIENEVTDAEEEKEEDEVTTDTTETSQTDSTVTATEQRSYQNEKNNMAQTRVLEQESIAASTIGELLPTELPSDVTTVLHKLNTNENLEETRMQTHRLETETKFAEEIVPKTSSTFSLYPITMPNEILTTEEKYNEPQTAPTFFPDKLTMQTNPETFGDTFPAAEPTLLFSVTTTEVPSQQDRTLKVITLEPMPTTKRKTVKSTLKASQTFPHTLPISESSLFPEEPFDSVTFPKLLPPASETLSPESEDINEPVSVSTTHQQGFETNEHSTERQHPHETENTGQEHSILTTEEVLEPQTYEDQERPLLDTSTTAAPIKTMIIEEVDEERPLLYTKSTKVPLNEVTHEDVEQGPPVFYTEEEQEWPILYTITTKEPTHEEIDQERPIFYTTEIEVPATEEEEPEWPFLDAETTRMPLKQDANVLSTLFVTTETSMDTEPITEQRKEPYKQTLDTEPPLILASEVEGEHIPHFSTQENHTICAPCEDTHGKHTSSEITSTISIATSPHAEMVKHTETSEMSTPNKHLGSSVHSVSESAMTSHSTSVQASRSRIYITLPVFEKNTTASLISFEKYYSVSSIPSTSASGSAAGEPASSHGAADDEATDKVFDPTAFRTMKLEDFALITESTKDMGTCGFVPDKLAQTKSKTETGITQETHAENKVPDATVSEISKTTKHHWLFHKETETESGVEKANITATTKSHKHTWFKAKASAESSASTAPSLLVSVAHKPLSDIPTKSTCKPADYESHNHCICAIDSLIKELRQQLANNSKQIKIGNFNCPVLYQTKNEITFGDTSKPKAVKLPAKSIFKREIIKSTNVDKILNEELNLKGSVNEVFASPGMKIQIPCFSKNSSDVPNEITKYTWQQSTKTPLTEGKTHEVEGTLIIDNISPSDGGDYTCTVTFGEEKTEKEFHHHLTVVSLPTYSITSFLTYNSSKPCKSEDSDIMSLYLPNSFGELLCGIYFPVCTVEVKTSYCNPTSKNAVSSDISIILQPMEVIMPTLNKTTCGIDCEMKIYTHILLFIIKNMESVEKLPVFFRLAYRHQNLTPLPRTPKAEKSQTSKLVITCPPGFGYHKDRHICGACPKNTYSSGEETYCTKCAPGQYQPMVGAKTCLVCSTPLQDPFCLRVVYANAERFKLAIGIAASILVVIIILLLLCYRGSGRHPAQRRRESLARTQRACMRRRNRDCDIERQQDMEPLLSRRRSRPKDSREFLREKRERECSRDMMKPPEPPPPDFF